MQSFLPIVILFGITCVVAIGLYTLTHLIGPNNPLGNKLETYECGVKPEGTARTPFKSSFYLVAVLFLLLDVEAAFFLPWALVYKESMAAGPELLIAMLVYMAFLVLGLVYVLRKRCLEVR